MKNIQISDRDIERVENLFFSNGGTFKDDNNERYNFIKCIDKSIHLQACPGSGKTTTLLAKIYLLSEKMPFENNRGICCLTHTNVAIDIIKKRLGDKADHLFRYPNFFGTIQSFVDRYLAIPAYIKMFGYRPLYIDTILQKERMENTPCLKGVKQEVFKKLLYYNHRKNIFGYYICKEGNEILNYQKGEPIDFKKPGKNKDWNNTEKEEIKKAACELKLKVLRDDKVLSFYDTYDFASRYLEKCPDLKNLFSSRFKYVFIDEAQDTSKVQIDIINALFDERVVVQWIGDVNQTIFNYDFNNISGWNPEKNERYKVYEITDSKRISQPIADLIKTVADKPYEELKGTEIKIKPTIILYNKDNIKSVLEKFVEIIKEHDLIKISETTGNPIKAVGWRAKEEKKAKKKKKEKALSIRDYFPGYNKVASIKRKQYFENLYTMLYMASRMTPKEFKNNLLNCILEVLYLNQIKDEDIDKYFSKSSFTKFIKSKDEKLLIGLNSKIAEWYLSLKNEDINSVLNDIKQYLECLFNKLSISINIDSKEYLTNNKLPEESNEQTNNKNIYISNNNPDINIEVGTVHSPLTNINIQQNPDINIEVGTVHSVKGETHTATLYLETEYRGKTCSEYLVNYILGRQNKNNKTQQQALKIAHVAFSRPTHLLCIAFENKGNIKEKLNSTNKFDLVII